MQCSKTFVHGILNCFNYLAEEILFLFYFYFCLLRYGNFLQMATVKLLK